MDTSRAQEFHDLKPGELTVRGNSIIGMVEIAILDADFKLVLNRQAVLDLIARLAGAQSRLERERGDRARVPEISAQAVDTPEAPVAQRKISVRDLPPA